MTMIIGLFVFVIVCYSAGLIVDRKTFGHPLFISGSVGIFLIGMLLGRVL